MQLQSSNPALGAVDDQFQAFYGAEPRADQATISGVIGKTGILVAIAAVFGMGGYALVNAFGFGFRIGLAVGSCVVLLAAGFVLRRNPKLAAAVGIGYAAIEGLFLGSLTSVFDQVIANALPEGHGLATVGLALPAFLITLGACISMLGLYSAGIIRPTQRFKAVVGTLAGAIFLVYLVMFGMSLFGTSMPFLSLNSAFEGGTPALIGLGFSLFTFVIASLYLVIDFGEVEAIVQQGAPRYMEWYGGFILLVTLAWIYFEALKLLVRLALIFGRDD